MVKSFSSSKPPPLLFASPDTLFVAPQARLRTVRFDQFIEKGVRKCTTDHFKCPDGLTSLTSIDGGTVASVNPFLRCAKAWRFTVRPTILVNKIRAPVSLIIRRAIW